MLDEQLIKAVEAGDLEAVERLLHEGADPNLRFDDRRSPASVWGGEKPWVWHCQGWERPVLHLAVLLGHLDIAQKLLEYGADIDAKDRGGGDKTALLLAVGTEHVEAVRMLLEAGADPNERCHGRPLVASIVGSGVRDEIAVTLVQLAVRYGSSVDVRAPSGGWTPLMGAANSGRVSRVKMLLKFGADSNAETEKGYTPLTFVFLAKMSRGGGNYKATVEALLAAGADPEAGFNPLMLAAKVGRSKKVRAALRRGISVNKQGPGGRTALHVGAKNGYEAVVHHLLKAGADPSIKDSQGQTGQSH